MSESKPAMPEQKAFAAPAGMPVFGASGRKIVYDENGKPCRACNTLLDFKSIGRPAVPKINKSNTASATSAGTIAGATAIAAAPVVSAVSESLESTTDDCPPDVEELGRSTWTLLHSIAATYPEKPTIAQQNNLTTFMSSFSNLYPCFYCADDFREYMKKDKIKVTNQEEFGKWLCRAHNEVNVKIGKPTFDCNLWKQRWKDGWEDGRCD